jgi:hypothetical protein
VPDVQDPGSYFTGAQREYLQGLAAVIRAIPNHSYTTLATPEGAIFGQAGDRVTYIGSTSTLSREWVNANTPGVVSTNSWVQLQVKP